MPGPIRTAIREHPLGAFFPLAFLLSWYPWLLSFAGVRASGINPLGVLVAALIVASLAGGWPEVKALLLRIVRVRVSAVWYLISVLLPLALIFLALALNLALGAATPTPAQWAKWPEIVDRLVFGFVFVGLGEEPGWRGYALPQLMRRRSALAAALIVGAVWAVWHLPLFGTEFSWPQAPAFVLSVFAGSIVTTWIFNSSGQSVFLTMLLHSVVNAVGAGYVFRFFTGAEYFRMWWIYVVLWLAAAGLVWWRSGAGLRGFGRA